MDRTDRCSRLSPLPWAYAFGQSYTILAFASRSSLPDQLSPKGFHDRNTPQQLSHPYTVTSCRAIYDTLYFGCTYEAWRGRLRFRFWSCATRVFQYRIPWLPNGTVYVALRTAETGSDHRCPTGERGDNCCRPQVFNDKARDHLALKTSP
jgi:hypothetical protein